MLPQREGGIFIRILIFVISRVLKCVKPGICTHKDLCLSFPMDEIRETERNFTERELVALSFNFYVIKTGKRTWGTAASPLWGGGGCTALCHCWDRRFQGQRLSMSATQQSLEAGHLRMGSAVRQGAWSRVLTLHKRCQKLKASLASHLAPISIQTAFRFQIFPGSTPTPILCTFIFTSHNPTFRRNHLMTEMANVKTLKRPLFT